MRVRVRVRLMGMAVLGENQRCERSARHSGCQSYCTHEQSGTGRFEKSQLLDVCRYVSRLGKREYETILASAEIATGGHAR